MKYVIPPHPQVYLPVQGTDAGFPVGRVFCVGKNYAAHAIEMGADPNREAPFFFMKSPECVVINDGDFPYPAHTGNVHHEIELAVALKSGGQNIPPEKTGDCIFGYAVCLDMTRRDIQADCKKKGQPWEVAKAFDYSAPCGVLKPKTSQTVLNKGRIELHKNGIKCQEGNIDQLIWKIEEIIAYLSEYFCLLSGDLILTGTPSGVGAVNKGDVLHGSIENIGEVKTKVV